MTRIQSNGSKWLGQEPDSIEVLLERLAEYPLDRSFEAYGDFASNCPDERGCILFFGNFFTYSHVFSIVTDDPAVIEPLIKAIKLNKRRDDYRAQDRPKMTRTA